MQLIDNCSESSAAAAAAGAPLRPGAFGLTLSRSSWLRGENTDQTNADMDDAASGTLQNLLSKAAETKVAECRMLRGSKTFFLKHGPK